MRNQKFFKFPALAALLLMVAALPLKAAELSLIHGIPGSDLGLDANLPVDISIGFLCVATNVPFRTIAEGVHVNPGIREIKFRAATTSPTGCVGPVLMAAMVPISFGENATVIAHLTDDGTIATTKFTNDLQPVGDGQARVTVRHTANAPTVDIVANGGVLFAGLSNGDQGKATVPSDTYNVSVNPAGSEDPVFGPAPIALPFAVNTVIYAIGTLANGTFEVLVQDFDL